MENVRPSGRDVSGVRQVVNKDTGLLITVDDQTFNAEWHEEVRAVARDPKVAKEQEDALKS